MKTTQIAQREIELAGELLSNYITHGALREPDLFDSTFEQISVLLQHQDNKVQAPVWRALTISNQQYSELLSNGTLHLNNRAFSSWSTDKTSALRFLRERSLCMSSSSCGILIERNGNDVEIIANVKNLYKILGWDNEYYPEWDNYVKSENEVIIRNNSTDHIINSSEVICHNTTRSLSHNISVSETIMRPFPGELFWVEEADAMVSIHGIPSEQPFCEIGVWKVEDEDGVSSYLESDRYGWKSIEENDLPIIKSGTNIRFKR